MSYKKIIASFLCIAIIIPCLVIPGFAAGSLVSGYEQATFWALVNKIYDDYFAANPNASPEDFDGFHGGYPDWHGAGFGGMTSERYNQYVSDIETDLGTTTLINGGVRVYLSGNNVKFDRVCDQTRSSYSPGSPLHIEWYSAQTKSYSNTATSWQVEPGAISLPFSCTYEAGHIAVFSSWSSNTQWGVNYWSPYIASKYSDSANFSPIQENVFKSGSGAAGNSVNLNEYWSSQNNISFTVGSINDHFIVDVYSYIDLFPVAGTSLPTTQDITINSRPTSIIGDYGIIGDNGTIVHVEGDMIVDESTNVFYNPVTNLNLNFTDWAYDYGTRTYSLTLEDGTTVNVEFGDENIVINEGDTIYNVYYLVPDDVPGTDDPGTDDPDTPGTDADVSGFFAWWKNAWNGFVDRLFTVLDGGDLEVILPGEEGNPEDEEDDGWTVFDLFALIRDALWKIITGVITVVLDGFLGLVDAIASLGDFFDILDPANPDGIFGVPGGGVELWS